MPAFVGMTRAKNESFNRLVVHRARSIAMAIGNLTEAALLDSRCLSATAYLARCEDS
jgi:hypothetical protein